MEPLIAEPAASLFAEYANEDEPPASRVHCTTTGCTNNAVARALCSNCWRIKAQVAIDGVIAETDAEKNLAVVKILLSKLEVPKKASKVAIQHIINGDTQELAQDAAITPAMFSKPASFDEREVSHLIKEAAMLKRGKEYVGNGPMVSLLQAMAVAFRANPARQGGGLLKTS